MKVEIKITATIPDNSYVDIKKLEHHLEYSGILENYPELCDAHVDVVGIDTSCDGNRVRTAIPFITRYPYPEKTLYDYIKTLIYHHQDKKGVIKILNCPGVEDDVQIIYDKGYILGPTYEEILSKLSCNSEVTISELDRNTRDYLIVHLYK